MILTGFGDRLSKIRKDNQLTQEEFSSRVGVTPQAISKWERDLSYPDLDLFYSICVVLHCSADTLLGIQQKSQVIESKDEKRLSSLFQKILAEPLMLEVGLKLYPMLDKEKDNDFIEIHKIREELAQEYGILMPIIHIRDNPKLEGYQYRIAIYGETVVDKRMEENQLEFISICKEIHTVCIQYYGKILNRQMMSTLVENVRKQYPAVINGVIPEKLKLSQLQKILISLIEKGKKVCNLIKIIEIAEESLEEGLEYSEIVDRIMTEL